MLANGHSSNQRHWYQQAHPHPASGSPPTKDESSIPRFKVERPPRRPPLDFEHLVVCFKSRFPDGFDGQDFHNEERDYKQKAASTLKEQLARGAFENLLGDGQYRSDMRKLPNMFCGVPTLFTR